jgi:SpoIID/LytB domain protein
MIYTGNIPKVSVGILNEEQIAFELYGDFNVYGMKKSFSGRFNAEIAGDKIICKGENNKIEISGEILLEPQDTATDSFLIGNVTIGQDFHWERKEKQRFKGSLRLTRDNDKILVVNILPIEDYLLSVISSEMSSKSSLQLLKAHAVVSRSWVFSQIEKVKDENPGQKLNSEYKSEDEIIKWSDKNQHTLFDVCADDHCQRYQGIGKISTVTSKIAIEETKGLVLISDNKICDARYSKSCGGITESFENVWEPVKHKYLAPIVDYKFEPEYYSIDFSDENNAMKWIRGNPPAFCNTHDKRILNQILLDYDKETRDFYRWKIEYSQKELKQVIKTKSGIDFGDIKELVPVLRGYSARLIKLKIVGTKKTLTVGKELEIRRWLSKTHLYSSAVFFEQKEITDGIPQKFIIHGAGWGHGVGMCQIGAAVMAAQGYQFDEILLHYFKNAKIKRIY